MASSSRFAASAGLIAVFTLTSRVFGLAREVVFSYFFSTSELLSAFRTAFQIPNLARRLFGEGALSAAMIPTLTESLKERGEEASRRFVGSLLVALVLTLGLAVVLAELVIAGWRTVEDDLALELTALLLPYAALICAAAVAGGVLNVRRHFAVPAALPILLNIAIVLAVVVGATTLGLSGPRLMYLIGYAVLAAGIAQVLVTLLALRRISFFPLFNVSFRDPYMGRVVRLMAPMVLGLAAVQINTLADVVIAYLFVFSEDGQRVGPAVLGYAHFLYQLPLGVMGISIATAVFPVLSAKAAEGDRVGLASTLSRGVRMALLVALPSSVGLMLVAEPLVASLFERGEFDAVATGRVSSTLLLYSAGLVAYFLQHLVVRAFYALKDSATPARAALVMVVVNLGLNLSLVFVMEERGLALATAVCATIQVVWLMFRLRRVLPELRWRSLWPDVWRMVAATGGMAAALLTLTHTSFLWHVLGTSPPVRLAVLIVVGVVVYALGAFALGLKGLAASLRPGKDSGSRTS